VSRHAGQVLAARAYLSQPARFHVEDKATDRTLFRDEGACVDTGHRLAYVLVKVREGLCRPWGADAGVFLDLAGKSFVAESEHPAVGVVDKDDLFGPEEALRDRERPDGVVGHCATGVADNVGVSLCQPENPIRVDSRVHAGHDGYPLGRWHPSPKGTPITPAAPRTGMPSGQIGRAVAQSIVDMLNGAERPTATASMAEMGATCVASAGANPLTGTAASMTVYPIVPDFARYPEYGRDMDKTFGEIGLAGHWIKILLHHLFLYKAKLYPGWALIPE
jgi:hypothetical protein